MLPIQGKGVHGFARPIAQIANVHAKFFPHRLRHANNGRWTIQAKLHSRPHVKLPTLTQTPPKNTNTTLHLLGSASWAIPSSFQLYNRASLAVDSLLATLINLTVHSLYIK